MSWMILEGKHFCHLRLGNSLMDGRSRLQIWVVHMEPSNACSPYVLLQKVPNRRQHPHGDIGVHITRVSPAVCRARCGNNRS